MTLGKSYQMNLKRYKCTKGYNCGAACISTLHNCRKEFVSGISVSINGFREAVWNTYSPMIDEWDKGIEISLDPIGYFVDKAEEEFGEELEKIRNLSKEYVEASSQREEALSRFSQSGGLLKGEELREASNRIDRFREIDKEVSETFENFREKLLARGSDREIASNILQEIKFQDEVGEISFRGEEAIKQSMIEYMELMGYRDANGLREIIYSNPRASAGSSYVNVGNSGNIKEVMFHEMAHILERRLGVHEYSQASYAFIESRATGPRTRLSELMPEGNFDDDEYVIPGNFIHPYVGKTYPYRSTEVVSMGVERFSSPEAMRDFFIADEGHFTLTLGEIVHSQNKGENR